MAPGRRERSKASSCGCGGGWWHETAAAACRGWRPAGKGWIEVGLWWEVMDLGRAFRLTGRGRHCVEHLVGMNSVVFAFSRKFSDNWLDRMEGFFLELMNGRVYCPRQCLLVVVNRYTTEHREIWWQKDDTPYNAVWNIFTEQQITSNWSKETLVYADGDKMYGKTIYIQHT